MTVCLANGLGSFWYSSNTSPATTPRSVRTPNLTPQHLIVRWKASAVVTSLLIVNIWLTLTLLFTLKVRLNRTSFLPKLAPSLASQLVVITPWFSLLRPKLDSFVFNTPASIPSNLMQKHQTSMWTGNQWCYWSRWFWNLLCKCHPHSGSSLSISKLRVPLVLVLPAFRLLALAHPELRHPF